jgi:putative transferase (TIGR04331 family)
MAYPWNDRERLYRDYQALDALFERVLPVVGNRLDRIHGERHSLRFWRIIVGPWLFHLVQILFERYLCLKTAAARYAIDDTQLVSERHYIVPTDFSHFIRLILGDAYNMVLYSQLVSRMREMPYTVRDDIDLDPTPIEERAAAPRGLQGWLRSCAVAVACRLARRNQVGIVGSYLPRQGNLLLHMRLRQFPMPSDPDRVRTSGGIDAAMRKVLECDDGQDEFERLVFSVLPAGMPRSYLEDYPAYRERARAVFPRRPTVIITANSMISGDLFKGWAAANAERGAAIVGLQHGGHYGSGKWNSAEKHEVTVADRYYSWGWSESAQAKVIPFVATKLVWAPGLAGRRTGRILWVLMSLPRYSYWMYSLPVGPQHLAYIEEQRRFAKSVSGEVLSLLLCRPYPEEYGWSEGRRLKDAVPALEVCDGRQSMQEQLCDSRLFVGTYNSTTFLETLSANYPTVLFWNPNHWELRPSAQPYYDALHEIGVLHYSPEDAAAKVHEVHEDPEGWWRERRVQEVRAEFCHRFARTSRNWLNVWSREIALLATGRSSNGPHAR